MPTDFTINNQGTIFLLTPLTEAAKEWARQRLSHDYLTWGPSIIVAPRYLEPIIKGIRADGLEADEI